MATGFQICANLDAPTRNLQNIEDKLTDQSAKKLATPCRIHVLPLLNYRCWKEPILKNVNINNIFCAVLQRTLCNESVDFVILKRTLFTLMHT